MLKDRPAVAIVAVSDIERARCFYQDVLELPEEADGPGGVLTFRCGGTALLVYSSEEAGTNRANAVVWPCGAEFDAIFADLAGNGVRFERYPSMDGVTMEGDIHVSGDMRLAWFKDPDGNVLHINNF